MNLTDEQQEIIKVPLYNKERVRISAYAGTGKTFTLSKVAEANPNLSFLYLAFNKSAQLDASNRMPPNVLCRTTHSMAFREFGKNRKLGEIYPFMASKFLKCKDTHAVFAIDTLKNYLSSSAKTITPEHMPYGAEEYWERKGDRGDPPYVRYAQELFDGILENKLNTPHDFYLKQYQLSKPRFRQSVVLLDEAQDTTPCVHDLVDSQNTAILYCGDVYQNIYAWRGAENSLEKVDVDHSYFLTRSFRFGPRIGTLASKLLNKFFQEKKPLSGTGATDYGAKNPDKPCAFLARTRSTLFDTMVGYLDTNYSMCHIGGPGAFPFQYIMDVYYLSRGYKADIKSPYLKSFNDIDDFLDFSRTIGDVSALSCYTTTQRYKSDLPGIIARLQNRLTDDVNSDLVFTTAHRAKGLEFDNVQICADFTDLIEALKDEDPVIKQLRPIDMEAEMRLLYVAITRAKKYLSLNSEIVDFIME
jgi:F-box protein 18 (helicase)